MSERELRKNLCKNYTEMADEAEENDEQSSDNEEKGNEEKYYLQWRWR